MTQNALVLNHLKLFGSITPQEALDLYGIMRLGARIYDLRREGVNITSRLVTAPNRYGLETRFAQYSLEV